MEHSSWPLTTNIGFLAVSTPRIMLAGEGARPTRGSPALKNGEYCYFHHRWQMTHVDLSQSPHHVTSMFDLPVLEDADSIQMALGQIMRMIVCRQVEPRAAGLLLYGLQIASANLRRTRFETCHKESITVDLFHVPERVLGDDAWSPADFKNADVGRAPSPAASSPAKETHVARTPSSAKESCASQTPPEPQPEAPSPAKESSSSDGGRTCPELKAKESPPATPRSAKESCAAPTPPEPQPKTPSSGNQSSPACDISSSSVASPQQRELQKAARAIPRALKGDWRCGALMRGRPKHAIC